ncbi:MAG: TorF family putative porin [Methylotenera sp.]
MKALNWITNRHVVSALCAVPLLFTCAYASAEDAAPAAATAAPAGPESPFTLSFNLGLYSEYMFRGVSLSDGPALQGGIDLGHSSGLYAGTWWSNTDPYFLGKGDGFSKGNNLETDWYVGYARSFENGFGFNVMGNYYFYPEGERSYSAANVGKKQNTFEASIALTYKYLTYTYYRALTDYYGAASDNTIDGTGDTKGADYHELKANYKLPVGGLNLLAKVGYQRVPNLLVNANEGDWAIGLNRDFAMPTGGKPIEGFNAGATYTSTFNVKDQSYYVANGRDLNSNRIWFFVKRTW